MVSWFAFRRYGRVEEAERDMAAVYINGVVLSVGQPVGMTKKDGTPVLDKSGVQMYVQQVVLQHDFQRNDGTGFNKYLSFEVMANSTNKRISKFAFRQGEEVEVGLDLDAVLMQDGRWFNRTPSCFTVERDKQKWHRPVQQRVATMPTAAGQNVPAYTPATPAQPVAAAPAQPESYAPQYNFPPAQDTEGLPF